MGIVKKLELKEVKKFLLIFNCVAIAGFLIPYSYPFFKFLIPFAILLNILLLINFHENWNSKFIVLAIIIIMLGFLAEAFGVNTGIIFGSYSYGKLLGPVLFNTPLIIGLNWIMLIYCTYAIIDNVKIHSILKLSIGAILLVIFDLIMEPVAVSLGMWNWENSDFHLKNSITWLIASFVFLAILKINRIKIKNEIAFYIIIYQFVFFVILLIYYSFL